jgi:hypothetical protein
MVSLSAPPDYTRPRPIKPHMDGDQEIFCNREINMQQVRSRAVGGGRRGVMEMMMFFSRVMMIIRQMTVVMLLLLQMIIMMMTLLLQIRAVGFDMDYTLAQYNLDFELLAYEGAKQKLVHDKGYPVRNREGPKGEG